MRKRRADALGALLSVSFLSCLFALLLVADQAFPPALQADGGIGLRGGIRGSPVLVGGADLSAVGAPALIASPAPSVTPAVEISLPVGDELGGTAEDDAATAERGPRPRETDTRDVRTARTPDTAEDKEKDKQEKGKGQKHGGGPPGHARGGGALRASGSGHGSSGTVGTPPGHGGTPPGHGGTSPGQDKVKDHGGKGRGKGKSKH